MENIFDVCKHYRILHVSKYCACTIHRSIHHKLVHRSIRVSMRILSRLTNHLLIEECGKKTKSPHRSKNGHLRTFRALIYPSCLENINLEVITIVKRSFSHFGDFGTVIIRLEELISNFLESNPKSSPQFLQNLKNWK
ncbi:uncharacterized protein LOC122506927 [Leptopilina heterotoma]|uniref:uncharacterized protein LOC122506927 n=1 Tax=Leptopilina heterotoma TaxID=63436 RepID=UPI001CA9DDF2|nr:uncharacterized protein LOC122506927 [Leptopilina heterotoma]